MPLSECDALELREWLSLRRTRGVDTLAMFRTDTLELYTEFPCVNYSQVCAGVCACITHTYANKHTHTHLVGFPRGSLR